MTLGVTEGPQFEETVTHTPQNMQDARTTTTIKQSIVMEVLILEGYPVSRDEATDEVNRANGILRPTQALILSRVTCEGKFMVENERIDSLQHDILE